MRLIDADALMETIRAHEYPLKSHFNSTDRGMFTIGIQQAVDEQPTITASPWHRVEGELPNDGEWAIFTNGKVVSVERFKEDAYNHFYPASQWFDFEDAIAWMPLPEPPKEDA